MGIRYSKIEKGNRREIVLLKSYPCAYGKCSFCNYIEDNSRDEVEMERVNFETLSGVSGEFGALEVINSGSVFELPKSTMEKIQQVVAEKNIKVLYFEIYYGYHKRLHEIIALFPGVEIRFRMGLETFDNSFRKDVYNKDFTLDDAELKRLGEKLYSVCLMICTKGQTREMIEKDIELGLKYFKSITINVFIDNGTIVKRDDDLVKWFVENHLNLRDNPRVELLIDNKDLGVFEQ